jgi:hypothetical protein
LEATATEVEATMAAATPAPGDKWLQGPIADVVLGGGLLYIPVLLLLLLGGPNARHALPFFVVPLVLLVCMNSHLGATLLRVYERPQDRHTYWFVAFYVSLVIGLVGLTGLVIPDVGSFFITFYLTMVPWHFTAQNYGVALILLRRHGVEITPVLKRFIYASFVLPFVLWILALHGAQPAGVEYSLVETSGTSFRFISVGIPGSVQGPAVILGILAYLWVLGECVLHVRRRASFRQLLPGGVLFLSQALWFAAPVIAAIFLQPNELGPFSPRSAGFTFVWVAVMHGVQYLWITAYYVKKERPGSKTPPFLAKSLLMGTAIYGLPVLILAPALAGRISYGGGIEIMLVAMISVHHFILDGAIWKLRDARIAQILIRGSEERGAPDAPSRPHWIKHVVLASGAVGVAIILLGTVEREYGVRRASDRGDVERLQTAAGRMRWMGRDDAATRAELGFLLGQQGDVVGAIREFERSIAIEPNAVA